MKVKIKGRTVETWSEDGKIVCPYCGAVTKADPDMFGTDAGTDTETETECGTCGRTFTARREVYLTYETFRQEENGLPAYRDGD